MTRAACPEASLGDVALRHTPRLWAALGPGPAAEAAGTGGEGEGEGQACAETFGAVDIAGSSMCQGLMDTTFKPSTRLGLDGGDTLPLHPSLVGHYLRSKPEPEPEPTSEPDCIP